MLGEMRRSNRKGENNNKEGKGDKEHRKEKPKLNNNLSQIIKRISNPKVKLVAPHKPVPRLR